MLGLILSTLDAIAMAFTDAARKKVLDKGADAGLVSVWCKIISCLLFGIVIVLLALFWKAEPRLPDIGASFGVSPFTAFLIYITINAVIEGAAILLNLRALQVSPISYCIPFMALTPVFLLPAGVVFLDETVTGGMVVGVALVVTGSLVVNRELFAKGALEPLRAILRVPGSRYMVMVAALLTLTNLLAKWFLVSDGGAVTFADKLQLALTLSVGKCVMLAIFFILLVIIHQGIRRAGSGSPAAIARSVAAIPWTGVLRQSPRWLVLAGFLEALVLVLMLVAMQFAVAAVVVSIKRSAVIWSVLLGWWMFRERNIADRLVAAAVMACGVLVFFLNKQNAAGDAIIGTPGALAVGGATIAAMLIALRLTRKTVATATPG
ncbi:MAG: EamA family transporter [Akkermansiaceae bacterium]|jgi:drug/metabolite transporter (DMT)-like permease|nr:EamA family transporter [Akkermansiaceae bacterium]